MKSENFHIQGNLSKLTEYDFHIHIISISIFCIVNNFVEILLMKNVIYFETKKYALRQLGGSNSYHISSHFYSKAHQVFSNISFKKKSIDIIWISFRTFIFSSHSKWLFFQFNRLFLYIELTLWFCFLISFLLVK